ISLAAFYLVPILLAVASFEWAAAAGVALACVVLRLLRDWASGEPKGWPLWVWWNSASSLLVFLFVIWIFSNLLNVYRQLEQRVADRTSEGPASARRFDRPRCPAVAGLLAGVPITEARRQPGRCAWLRTLTYVRRGLGR